MNAALEALLTEMIDYAGLFPPAELPLDKAVQNYAAYRQEPEGWMLGRFVCPAARLGELVPAAQHLFTGERPLRLAVTAGPVRDFESLVSRCAEARAAIERFRAAAGACAVVELGEVRLPAEIVRDEATFARWCEIAEGKGGCETLPQHMMLFYELAPADDWFLAAARLIDWIARRDAVAHTPTRGAAGFKLRCGGVDPAAVPSVAQVAWVIRRCRDAEIPLKFTAGLHHPVRHYDARVRAFCHGFINVFVAGVISHALALDEADIIGILDEIDLRQFRFTDEVVGWADAEADIAEILVARRSRIISLGSCSFDEPREGLRRAGLLP